MPAQGNASAKHATAQQKMIQKLEKDTDPETFLIDNAFLKACGNCGIDPVELKGRPLDAFQSKGVPEDVAIRKFNNFQNARVRKLHLVVNERKRLLADETNNTPRAIEVDAPEKTETERSPERDRSAKDDSQPQTARPRPPPGTKGSQGRRQHAAAATSDDGSLDGSQTRRANEKDMMVQRALRQRSFWDSVNERVKKSQDARAKMREQEILRSKEYAQSYRKRRETEEEQKRQLHRINQEQMKKRWQRDDELADIRQRRIDEEFEHKIQLMQLHLNEVETARKRRETIMATVAKEGSDETTAARLQKAKELREAEDEKKREQAIEQVNKVEERRRQQVFRKFIEQARLSEKALDQRKGCQEVLDRAEKLRQERILKIMERIDTEEERSDRRLDEQADTKMDRQYQEAVRRDQRHMEAKEKRRAQAEEAEKKRQEIEDRRARAEKERRERQELEAALAREDANARQEHHEHVLKRVARVAEAQQEEKLRNFEQQQKHASDRIKQLSDIRSLLHQ